MKYFNEKRLDRHIEKITYKNKYLEKKLHSV